MKRKIVLALLMTISLTIMGCGSNETALREPAVSTENSVVVNTETELSEESMVEETDTDDVLARLGLYSRYNAPKNAEGNNAAAETVTMGENENNSGGGEGSSLSVGQDLNGNNDDDIVQGSNDVGIFNPDDEENVSVNGEVVDDTVSGNLGQYSGDTVEFINYTDQTITNTNRAIILSNLSVNGSFKMKFIVKNGENVLYESDFIDAGGAVAVDGSVLKLSVREEPYVLTIVSQAYSADFVQLNSVTQDVKVTVVNEGGEHTDSVEYDKQTNGTTYTTTVVYNADNMEFSTIVPAVVAIEKGDIGTDMFVNFRAANAKKGTSVIIKATGADGKATITLAGSGSGIVAGKLSSSESAEAVLSYKFSKDDSVLEKVGPIHCVINDGYTAASDIFGTINFDLALKTK